MIFSNTTLTPPRLAMFLIALAMIACDSTTDEPIGPENQLTFGEMRYYAVPGSTLFIDATSFIEESFVNTTLSISTRPTNGALSKLDHIIFQYEPEAYFTTGTDKFVVSVLVDGQNRHTETVTIVMKSEVNFLPCGLYAIEDNADVSAGFSQLIPVLENDGLCGAGSSALEVSVYAGPAFGDASVAGNIITYTPGPNFTDRDELVYKLSAVSGDSVSYAAVKIGKCMVTALADTIRLKDGFSVNILTNDILCRTREIGLTVSISSSPQFGTASLIGDSVIVYSPGFDFEGQDQLSYQLQTNSSVTDATVIIVDDRSAKNIELLEAPEGVGQLFFVNEMTGFVAGNGMFKTTNGGETWTELTLPTDGWISDLRFLTEQMGYATYEHCENFDDYGNCLWNGGLLITSDGGASWDLISFNTAAHSVYFTSATSGYVSVLADIGQPEQKAMVYKTEDGGDNWEAVFSVPTVQIDEAIGKYEVMFASNNIGYVWGDNGMIDFTEDAGGSWRDATTHSDYSYAVTVTQDFAFAKCCSPGSIAKRAHGGNWRSVISFPFDYMKLGFSPSGNHGIAVGITDRDGWGFGEPALIGMVRTKDQGETWTIEKEKPGEIPWDVSVPSDKVAYFLFDRRLTKYSYP